VGSRDPLCNFGTPNISGTNGAKNFKFGTEMEGPEYLRKNAKLGRKASCGCHFTHFANVAPTVISPGGLMLETSKLANRWMAVSTNEKIHN